VQAAQSTVDLDTSAGKIRIELFPMRAQTVEPFIAYVKSSNSMARSSIASFRFMIQAGGYTADFTEKRTHAAPLRMRESRAGRLVFERAGPPSPWLAPADPPVGQRAVLINVADKQPPQLPRAFASGYGYTVFGKVGRRDGRGQQDCRHAYRLRGQFPTMFRNNSC